MKKLTLKEKAQLILTEIEKGILVVEDDWLLYGAVSKYNSTKKVGDRVGYKHNQCEGCWYCQLQVGDLRVLIALSYVMFAYNYGIESIHEGMEIRFRDGNMFNFSKENMVDASKTYNIDQLELKNNITKRIELILNKIKDEIYYVKNGVIYYGASGKNATKDEEMGCLDNNGYIQHRISAYHNMRRIRVHQVLYAYYHGLENFDENMVIHHKDGNRANNLEQNLEQIAYIDNARGTYPKLKFNTKDKIQFLIDRINIGIYKIDVTEGTLYYGDGIKGYKAGDIAGYRGGYHRINFRFERKRYSVPLHNVIYYYVHGIEQYREDTVIDHIDNNTLNNSINNLQQISHRANSKKGNRS